MKALEYANKTGEQTAQELNTSIEHGLTVKQVALMRKEIGFEEKTSHLGTLFIKTTKITIYISSHRRRYNFFISS